MVQNIAPSQVWETLLADETAHLVDVRTEPEWNFVGVPELRQAGKKPILIAWQIYPFMQVNGNFVEQLREAGFEESHKLFFLCRSGVRSLAAAKAAVAAGFPHSFNIADGFEGPPDAQGHRGSVAGWKASGLPWRQG
jgi:rhodanese-related sulfurtransferase